MRTPLQDHECSSPPLASHDRSAPPNRSGNPRSPRLTGHQAVHNRILCDMLLLANSRKEPVASSLAFTAPPDDSSAAPLSALGTSVELAPFLQGTVDMNEVYMPTWDQTFGLAPQPLPWSPESLYGDLPPPPELLFDTVHADPHVANPAQEDYSSEEEYSNVPPMSLGGAGDHVNNAFIRPQAPVPDFLNSLDPTLGLLTPPQSDGETVAGALVDVYESDDEERWKVRSTAQPRLLLDDGGSIKVEASAGHQALMEMGLIPAAVSTAAFPAEDPPRIQQVKEEDIDDLLADNEGEGPSTSKKRTPIVTRKRRRATRSAPPADPSADDFEDEEEDDAKAAQPYLCDDCNQSFTRSFDLARHQKEKHSEERNFRCVKCSSSSFKRKDQLLRHERDSCLENPLSKASAKKQRKKRVTRAASGTTRNSRAARGQSIESSK